MRNATDIRRELEFLLRSRCPAIGMETWEEVRALRLIREVARPLGTGRDIYTWTSGQGLKLEGRQVLGLRVPCTLSEALSALGEQKNPAVYVFFDADLEDPTVARQIRDATWPGDASPRSLIFVTPRLRLHPTLTRVITPLELAPPDRVELKTILNSVAARCASLVGVELELGGDAADRLAEAARGMTAAEAERAFVRVLLQVQRLSVREVPHILREKQRLFADDPLLEYVIPSESLDELGGLEVLRKWLGRRGRGFSDAAVQAGLPPPRGVLLVGMVGCGRAHAIRGAAARWGLPLLSLRTTSLVGERDGGVARHLQSVLHRVESLAPCILWIENLDRLFEAGSEVEGGRASTPVSAMLQRWLLEKESAVFVAASAENFERLPLELLWKRAFDEVFFIDFPSSEERRQILKVLLRRRGLLSDEINLEMLVAASEGFSGAQIDQALVRGMREAFDQGRPVKMVDIVQSLRKMTPMAGFMGESRRRLRGWAHRRAMAASPVKEP